MTIGQNLKAANAYSTLPEVDLISLDLDEVFIGNTNSMIDYAGTTVTTMLTTYPLNNLNLAQSTFVVYLTLYSAKLTHKSRF